jgi:hypothetical protein
MSSIKYTMSNVIYETVWFHRERVDYYFRKFNQVNSQGDFGQAEYLQQACEWHKSELVKKEIELQELYK